MGMFLRRHAEEVEAKLAAAKTDVASGETAVEKVETKAKTEGKGLKSALESEVTKLEEVVKAIEEAV